MGSNRDRMTHAALALATGALLLGLGQAPVLAQQSEVILYQEDFDAGTASGWQLDTGWRVVDGVLSGEGRQSARLPDHSWRDFRVRFRLNLIKGDLNVDYRYSGSMRYIVGFRPDGLHLAKRLGQSTLASDLALGRAPFGMNSWHEVEIAERGGHIQVTVDGKLGIDFADLVPLTSGGLSFETQQADAAAQVDDVVVYGLPPDSRFTWVSTGGPPGGTGYDIRMRPDSPDIMLVTDAMAGIFVSADAGANWFPSNEGITTRAGESGDVVPAFCATIDPHDPNIVWLGMQNARGIYKSTDGGRTWVAKVDGIAERNGITFRGFTVDPRSSDIVYAAAEISSFEWAGQPRTGISADLTKGVVYRTTDGGIQWSAIWRGDNLARYVWIDPRDPNVIYISTGIFDREAANSDPAAGDPGGEGILKSIDGGQTWSRTNAGLENLYVGSLFMHPENPDILLAGVGADIGTDNLRWSPPNNPFMRGSGVYISTDAGGSWRRVLRSPEAITSVEFSTSDPRVAYAGSLHWLYRSENGGESWTPVAGYGAQWGTAGYRSGRPIDVQVDPRDSNRIFSNSYNGGNFLSADGGRSWTSASSGYTGAQVRGVAVDPEDGEHVFAAARSGIFVTQNGGGEWSGITFPPVVSEEWTFIAVDPTDRQHLLASTNAGTAPVAQSRDGGRSWRPVVSRPDPRMGWRGIAFAPSDTSIVYVGTGGNVSPARFGNDLPGAGVYVSRNGGSNWSLANGGAGADAHVLGLAVDPQDTQTVYAATTNHGILRTNDGGLSWAEIGPGTPSSRAALSIAVHPSDPRILFAGLDRGGVSRSDDRGDTWRSSSAGMNPEGSVTAILFDPTNPSLIFAADSHSGAYRSRDGGATWSQINAGLLNRSVYGLAISADGQHLYAATDGGGVFRLDLGGEPLASGND